LSAIDMKLFTPTCSEFSTHICSFGAVSTQTITPAANVLAFTVAVFPSRNADLILMPGAGLCLNRSYGNPVPREGFLYESRILNLCPELRSMAERLEKNAADCGIPAVCERIVPAWLVILDNAPTLVMFFLGSALIWKIHPVFSVLFLIYCGLSIVLFWRLICPWCHHYGSSACPCGYGKISSQFFKRKTGREFKRVFRKNIGILFPCWMVPLGTGLCLLWTKFTWPLFSLFLAFCIVGFVLIPAISKLVGCRSCEIKAECPWMS
jgi:hypothetical protein